MFGITNSDSTRTNNQVSDKHIHLRFYTYITALQCICMAANGWPWRCAGQPYHGTIHDSINNFVQL